MTSTIAAKATASVWVIFLEMGLALALLVLIVWWTWPSKRLEDERPPPPGQKD